MTAYSVRLDRRIPARRGTPPRRGLRRANRFTAACTCLIAAAMSMTTAPACSVPPNLDPAPIMGLSYQPYVGQWSAGGDNPYAPGRLYTPAFNSYRGGISVTEPDSGLWQARQEVALRFDAAGQVTDIQAEGTLKFDPTALRGASPSDWSRTYFKPFEGTTPLPTIQVDHQGSVYRQLEHLVQAAGGAPLTLTTYGTGFEIGYWRRLGDDDYVTLPVWAENQVDFYAEGASTPTTERAIDELYFYFPPESAYVIPAPGRAILNTTGTAGRDLALSAVHLTVFEPAKKGDADAVLNPGFFLGDANAQVALAAAEINAKAGKTLLSIKQGVPNIALDGTLVNPRMRFAIRSALAQAQVANARHPGTVTHLIISNEYAEIAAPIEDTPTRQVIEMVRFAREQIAAGADFEGMALAVGVRSHSFRGIDVDATDPAIRRFTQDVRELIQVADVLMENIYPSPDAVEQARTTGTWNIFFDQQDGELSLQWQRLNNAIRALADGKPIDLMIGEIGHPTNGIAFNLPGYGIDAVAITAGSDSGFAATSAFTRVSEHLTEHGSRISPPGLDILQAYFNPTLSAAFLTDAFLWSRAKQVQIHAFEGFDEPHKSAQNPPLPDLDLAESTLNHAGPYGAEGFYGLFRYRGVAGFSAQPGRPIQPGAKLIGRPRTAPQQDSGQPGPDWATQFAGRFEPTLPSFDFKSTAHAFVHQPD